MGFFLTERKKKLTIEPLIRSFLLTLGGLIQNEKNQSSYRETGLGWS